MLHLSNASSLSWFKNPVSSKHTNSQRRIFVSMSYVVLQRVVLVRIHLNKPCTARERSCNSGFSIFLHEFYQRSV